MEIIDTTNYVCFDLETTSTNVKKCDIIEIGAVRVRDNEIVNVFESLVRPFSPIPRHITALTGITIADGLNAPEIHEVLEEFLKFIGDDLLVGHNIDAFDIPILKRACEEYDFEFHNKTVDTLQLALRSPFSLPNHKLSTLCEYYGVENENAHTALSDAKATREVFEHLVNFDEGDIYNISPESARSFNTFFGKPKFTDASLALQELHELLYEVVYDGIVSSEEIDMLKAWLDSYQELKGNFPYDYIVNILNSFSLEANSIDDYISAFYYAIDPVSDEELTETASELVGKNFVLAGDFDHGTYEEMLDFVESFGGINKNAVSGKTDYVVVGNRGSTTWTNGSYGSKIKKALECQAKGAKVKVISEAALLNCLTREVENV